MDKPEGLTSHDVVARVRRILKIKRVGHTGTLDPFATGVLVVLMGRATRLAQFLSGAEKEYEAIVRLGYATDTGDSTGEAKGEVQSPKFKVQGPESEQEIEAALAGFRGEIEQVPPMYSAKKVQGKKLYEMARRGVEVERKAVRVVIHELEAKRLDDGALLSRNEDGTYDLSIRVVCSAGTYIRTLAEAIGERLGVPAHLASLRRTRAGNFRIEDAIGLDELKDKVEAEGDAGQLLTSMDAALSWLPFVHLKDDEARMTLHGAALKVPVGVDWAVNQPVRMRDKSGRLIAIGFYDTASKLLRPRVVLFPEK